MDVPKKAPIIATFLKGEAVSAFWNFLSKAIALLNTFLTITSLSLYQYGVFQLLLSFAGISSDVLNLGSSVVSNEISRSVGENRASDAKRIFLQYSFVRIFLIIILWVIVFFGATYIFSSYDIDFVKDMRLISFLFISEGIFLIIRTLAMARLQFGLIAQRLTINKAVQAVILVYFFLQDDLGLKQLILSIIIASAVSVLCVVGRFFKIYSEWNTVSISSKNLLWDLFVAYGTWDIARQFVNRAVFRIKPWLIKLFVGTEAVAIYSIAETMITALQDILPSTTLQSLVPMWVKDRNLSIKMFSYGIKYFLLLGIIVALVALAIVPPVVHIFFSKYNLSLQYFYVMLINLPIFAAGIIIGNYIIAFREQKYLLVLHLTRAVLTLGIIALTLPFIGLWGLAIEFVLVPLMMVIMNYMYTKNQDKGFHFDFKVIFGFNQEDKEVLRKASSIIKGWFRRILPSF